MSAVIALTLIITAVLYFIMGYPLFEIPGGLGIRPGDPFWTALNEYDAMVDSILAPLYPEPGPNSNVFDSTAIVQYFIDNDFINEIYALDKIYQKAIQGGEDSKDQRQKAKNFRTNTLNKMKKSLESFSIAMEIIQKYADQDERDFTQNERRQLSFFISRSTHRMIGND